MMTYKEEQQTVESAFLNWRQEHRPGTWAWYPSQADIVRLVRSEAMMRDDSADRRLR